MSWKYSQSNIERVGCKGCSLQQPEGIGVFERYDTQTKERIVLCPWCAAKYLSSLVQDRKEDVRRTFSKIHR